MASATVEDHAKHVAGLLEATLHILKTEPVPLDAALGRVTAQRVVSPVDLPLFRTSQMDGFAVHADDLAVIPFRLRVVGEISAGTARVAGGGAHE
jgi:molybdopterin molybdotransferase